MFRSAPGSPAPNTGSQANPRRSDCGQSGTATGFSPSNSVSPVSIIAPMAQ